MNRTRAGDRKEIEKMKKETDGRGKRNEIKEEWMERRCEEKQEGEVNECTGNERMNLIKQRNE